MTVGVIYYVLIFDLLSLDHKQWYLLKMNVSDIRNVKNKKIITIWFFCLIMPNLGELIFTLPVPTRHEIRKLEKVFLKLQKTELTCAFNESCLRENILSKYTQYKIITKNLHGERRLKIHYIESSLHHAYLKGFI